MVGGHTSYAGRAREGRGKLSYMLGTQQKTFGVTTLQSYGKRRGEAEAVAGAKRRPSRPVPFRDQHVLFYTIVICTLLSCTNQQKHG